jgi:hypothetical protein
MTTPNLGMHVISVSVEKHKGRIMVRVESPEVER